MQNPFNHQTLNLEIAEITISIDAYVEDLIEHLRQRYQVYEVSGSWNDINLQISHAHIYPDSIFAEPHVVKEGNILHFSTPTSTGLIDLLERRAELSVTEIKREEDVDYFIRVLIALLAFQSGGLLVHGAGIVIENLTYIFFGHSGSGKTTVSKLSKNGIILSDDLVVVKPSQTGWKVFATPFGRLVAKQQVQIGHDLTKMFRLIKDDKNYLVSLPASQSIAELLGSAPVVSNLPDLTNTVITRCKEITQSVPIYELHFLPNDTFWKLIH